MIDDLLFELRSRKIRLRVVGDKLVYEAPKGALSEDLRERMREHKPALLERLSTQHSTAFEPIPSIERGVPAPLSFAQQRMWFLWKLEPESTAYCVPIVTKVTGPLVCQEFRKACSLVRERHEVLRTRFIEVAGQPYQILSDSPFDFQMLEIHPCDGEAKAMSLIQTQIEAPVDLTQGVTFEVRLVRVEENTHFFLLRLHHIAFDGWSNKLLMSEICEAYQAYSEGREPDLPSLPIQYADFATWQRQRLSSASCTELLSYWTNRIKGVQLHLTLPRRRDAPGQRGTLANQVRFTVPTELTTKLAQLGRAHGSTMFMTLVSALRILLWRYSSERDFLIGTPSIRRTHPDTEKLIGYFGNTLLLRSALQPEDTYITALEREREVALSAYENQDVPFDMVVEALAPPRLDASAPLFQVMFLFGESAPAVYPIGKLEIEFLETSTTAAKFDLSVWAKQLPNGGLSGHFEYATSQFECSTIQRMTAHFERILGVMATEPESPISATELLGPTELDLIIRRWNPTGRPSIGPPLHERFAAMAARIPEALAIVHKSGQLKYGELNSQVQSLAGWLVASGVLAGDPVVVCLPRTPTLVATLLAVMKVGAVYIPVDSRYPTERARFILRDSGARIVVTDASCQDRWIGFDCKTLLVERVRSDAKANAVIDWGLQATDAAAYVLYTSGSTGQPKGVEITQRAAASMVTWALDTFDSNELELVLAGTSVCFDLFVFETFVPLCGGYSIALVENPLEIHTFAARDSVTLINTVPSVMRAMLAVHNAKFPRALRTVCLAGERLDSELVDQVYRRTGARKVYDLYGPTEATTFATCKLREPGAHETIGRPIANTRAYVLDSAGLPVPVGVRGELWLAGDSLARGYWRQTELTNERFVTPRSQCIPETRLYRTGDLVRHAPDGELEYIGRIDDQIKVRGYRIEPGEVRTAMLSIAGVKDAAVVGRTRQDSATELVAYIVSDSDAISSALLKAELAKLLPDYMLPSAFVHINELPLGFNGKLDASRLPDQDRPLTRPAAHPLNSHDSVIAAIWEEVIGEAVTAGDNFFELGGTSLSAMTVIGCVNSRFGINLPLRSLFDHATLSKFAASVLGAAHELAPEIPRADLSADVPSTLLQRHLWRVHHAVEEPTFLNLWKEISLPGECSTEIVEQVLQDILEHYIVLRAGFPPVRRGRVQRFGPAQLNLKTLDLRGAADDERRRRLASFRYELGAPFRLDGGPCARFGLVRESSVSQFILLVVHHIVVDEWSLDVLEKQIKARCQTGRLATPKAPPPETVNFADYAVLERQELAGEQHADQLAWWISNLKPPLAHLDFGRENDSDELPLATHTFPIPYDLWEGLSEIACRKQASMFTVLLSGLALLLARQSSESDIRICTNASRRHRRGFEATFGPLTDSLIVRTELSHELHPLDAVDLVRKSLLESFERLDVPFEEIMKALSVEYGLQRDVWAPAFFLLHEATSPTDVTGGMPMSSFEPGFFTEAVHSYDVILHVSRKGSSVDAQLTTTARVATGPELASAYLAMLREFVDHPGHHEAAANATG